MKLEALQFDTPDNACLSLRIMAEKVRTGEVVVVIHEWHDNSSLPHGPKLQLVAVEPMKVKS